jgi:hypothetical protein
VNEVALAVMLSLSKQVPVDFDKFTLTPSLFLLNEVPSAEECDATKAK